MFRIRMDRAAALVLAAVCWAGAVQAQALVDVKDAWARATVPGQQGSGAFMTLTAAQDAVLLGGSSPAAGVVEIHEMVLQDDVMRMRPIASLPLPAGQAVTLKPGGLHVMLMELKAPLAAGSELPLTLRLRDGAGVESSLELQVPVRALNAPRGAASGHGGHGH